MAMTLSRKQAHLALGQSREAAFEALFEQHWERLCRVLYNLLGDWSEAQDLALDTFVQLYQRPPAQTDNLGSWLYRVATNLGLNTLRSQKRRQRYEEQALVLLTEDTADDNPASLVEKELERQQVQDALKAIKPRSAKILILRHSGLSYAEIAQVVGIPSSSVGTLLVRAEKEFEYKYRRLNHASQSR